MKKTTTMGISQLRFQCVILEIGHHHCTLFTAALFLFSQLELVFFFYLE